MKLMIIHHSGLIGGGTLSCIDVAKALKKILKPEDKLLVSMPIGSKAEKLAIELNCGQILSHKYSAITFGYYNGGANTLRIIVKLFFQLLHLRYWKAFFQQHKPDMVILNSIVLCPLIILLNKLNIKSSIFVRETMRGKKNSLQNNIIKYFLNKSDIVNFISEYDMEQWNLSKAVQKNVLPDVVNIKEFSKTSVSKDKILSKFNLKTTDFLVLYAGGINELKGAQTALEAIGKSSNLNIKLLVLGNLGKEFKNLVGIKRFIKNKSLKYIEEFYNYIEKNNLKDKVRLIGIQKEVNNWCNICDVAIIPISKAHQSRLIYEAGVFYKPVVATDFPNYREFIKNGVNGFVFPNHNSKLLKEKLEKLASDALLKEKLGKENHSFTCKFHNAQRNEQKICDIYKEFVQKN